MIKITAFFFSIVVFKDRSDPLFDCLNAERISSWQPLDITTYVLSVFQIEKLINKLNRVISGGISDEAALVRDRDNWMAVLESYRNHSASVMPVFSNNDEVLNAAVNSISSPEGDMQVLIDNYMALMGSTATHTDVMSTFSRLKAVCGDAVLRSSSSNLCTDFQPTRWASLAAALDHVCTNTTLDRPHMADLGRLCNNNPDGSTFAFLQDTTKYLSYASHSPVNMKFTSAVSNSLSLRTSFRSLAGESTVEEKTIYLGAVSTKNHQDGKSTREVSIAFGDNNQGQIFGLVLDIFSPFSLSTIRRLFCCSNCE
jgi:hypothetical protein